MKTDDVQRQILLLETQLAILELALRFKELELFRMCTRNVQEARSIPKPSLVERQGSLMEASRQGRYFSHRTITK